MGLTLDTAAGLHAVRARAAAAEPSEAEGAISAPMALRIAESPLIWSVDVHFELVLLFSFELPHHSVLAALLVALSLSSVAAHTWVQRTSDSCNPPSSRSGADAGCYGDIGLVIAPAAEAKDDAGECN